MLAAASQRVKDFKPSGRTYSASATRDGKLETDSLSWRAWCRTVAENIQELTYDQKRLALDALGVRVTVWRKGDRAPRIEASIRLV